jgi:hypothetical protein
MMNIVAFEAMNQIKIVFTLSVEDFHGRGNMRFIVNALKRPVDESDPKPLASVSVTSSGMNLRNLEACLIHALYLLDGKLASDEMRGAENK